MTRRTRVVLLSIAGIGALQAALWFGFRAVTESRREPGNTTSESLDGRRAPLQAKLLAADGRATTLAELGRSRPVLLHFWATWCAPCQKELPTLLELAASPERPPRLQIVLVSLDQEWRPVEAFFQGAVPPLVRREAGGLASALDVSVLPDTYLLAPDGHALARFRGARDWSSPELVHELSRWLDASP